MGTDTQLTLGFISFLNCVPFFARLKESGFKGDFVAGVPSELNRMLQEGELDGSPSSSFEYARNWRDYVILPNHSIASQGAVKSVLLFSTVEPHQLEGRRIVLTGESATSINLLRVLLREFYHLKEVLDYVPENKVEALIERGEPGLLIGDRALKMARDLPDGVRVFDLGEMWTRKTGLPFVFALWMIRKNILGKYEDQLKQLEAQLMSSRRQVLSQPDRFAEDASERTGLDVSSIIDYWNTIDYRLDEEHQKGLTLFFHLCEKYGLLTQEPELNFMQ